MKVLPRLYIPTILSNNVTCDSSQEKNISAVSIKLKKVRKRKKSAVLEPVRKLDTGKNLFLVS